MRLHNRLAIMTFSILVGSLKNATALAHPTIVLRSQNFLANLYQDEYDVDGYALCIKNILEGKVGRIFTLDRPLQISDVPLRSDSKAGVSQHRSLWLIQMSTHDL